MIRGTNSSDIFLGLVRNGAKVLLMKELHWFWGFFRDSLAYRNLASVFSDSFFFNFFIDYSYSNTARSETGMPWSTCIKSLLRIFFTNYSFSIFIASFIMSTNRWSISIFFYRSSNFEIASWITIITTSSCFSKFTPSENLSFSSSYSFSSIISPEIASFYSPGITNLSSPS